MESEMIEFQRLHHGAPAEELMRLLEEADIHFKTGSTAPTFDLSTIGSERAPEVIFSVRKEDFAQARAILEAEYSDDPLPEDHHLRTATDDDLIDILCHESEWSAFDVAHARQMAVSRGVKASDIERERAQKLRLRSEGKQAPRLLVVGGFVCAIIAGCGFVLFGIAGIGIGWSLRSMMDKTPEGVFPSYDEASRRSGVLMIWFSAVALLIGIGSRLWWFGSL